MSKLPTQTDGLAPHRRISLQQRLPWREKAVARLQHLVRLPVGWDGYKAPPVDLAVATFALRILDIVCELASPEPELVPGSNGDLQIEWHTHRGDIELQVLNENEVCGYFADLGKMEHVATFREDFDLAAQWLAEITEQQSAAVTAAE